MGDAKRDQRRPNLDKTCPNLVQFLSSSISLSGKSQKRRFLRSESYGGEPLSRPRTQ